MLVINRCCELQTPKSNIFSRLAQSFPFILKLLGKNHQQSNDHDEGNNFLKEPFLSEVLVSPDSGELDNRMTLKCKTGNVEQSEELETVLRDDFGEVHSSSDNSGTDKSGMSLSNSRTESFNFDDQITEGTTTFQREQLNSWILGPGYQIAQKWAKEKTGTGPLRDKLSIFHLPIGVRYPEESNCGMDISPSMEFSEPKTEDNIKEQIHAKSSISYWGALNESVAAARDFYDDASTPLTGRNTDLPKKQGVLSVRAASMLFSSRKLSGIHQKVGALLWKCITEEESTRDGAKEVFLKEKYYLVALQHL
ncbi:hypothetical protein Tsubulata_051403 [Turnera subulata]|uniref:Uncharacterized protein n=1 Tax=Turnera subulata TaxID=218843 RepID=A0A9Q0GGA4_9ROSI|nr:hypothetical protein Tsubulata_051403 [Turnera subulata]